MNASIFNEVLGPVMIGPSSSHTAGPARIGRVGWQMLAEEAREIQISFDPAGSFAACYNSQGSDYGFVGGLLGINLADDRMRNALETAAENGIEVRFCKVPLKTVVHPNQAEIHLVGRDGRVVDYTAISTGGGMFEVLNYQGFPVSMKGDSYDILVTLSSEEDAEAVKVDLKRDAFKLTEGRR